jgi:hypothetical protein
MINDLWYKNAVIYCLSVGNFMDANGDGIGDFQELVRRLSICTGLASQRSGSCLSSLRIKKDSTMETMREHGVTTAAVSKLFLTAC